MSQQNNWADSSLLQGRCLCIRNATRKQNIYLPSFHKTERFRSAMDRMSHKPVLPAPLMPVWPALGCTTGRANLSTQVTSGLRSGSKKLPKWHAPQHREKMKTDKCTGASETQMGHIQADGTRVQNYISRETEGERLEQVPKENQQELERHSCI